MATSLDKELTRETSVMVNDRVIKITLTEKQTIFMLLKGMKSGGVEISIEDLYKQLKGDIEEPDTDEKKPVIISHENKSNVKGDNPMISLHDLRNRCNISGFDYAVTAKLDGIFKSLIDERK